MPSSSDPDLVEVGDIFVMHFEGVALNVFVVLKVDSGGVWFLRHMVNQMHTIFLCEPYTSRNQWRTMGYWTF